MSDNQFDLANLPAAPWTNDNDFEVRDASGDIVLDVVCTEIEPSRHNALEIDKACLAFAVLSRNDLDVKQRLHWNTARCEEADQWFVPQLVPYLPIDGCIDAMYQKEHDVGLLTKACEWYYKNVGAKNELSQANL